MTVAVRAVGPQDRGWIEALLRERWLGDTVVVHGVRYRPAELPALGAFEDVRPMGLLTYLIEAGSCEIVTIDAVRTREGVGTAMLDAVAGVAQAQGCRRLWLVTTNDNDMALAFYLARGFSLVAVHEDVVAEARAMKPSIPLVNDRGVPIRDELELTRAL